MPPSTSRVRVFLLFSLSFLLQVYLLTTQLVTYQPAFHLLHLYLSLYPLFRHLHLLRPEGLTGLQFGGGLGGTGAGVRGAGAGVGVQLQFEGP